MDRRLTDGELGQLMLLGEGRYKVAADGSFEYLCSATARTCPLETDVSLLENVIIVWNGIDQIAVYSRWKNEWKRPVGL